MHPPTRPQLVLELRQRFLQLSDATRAIGVVKHPPKHTLKSRLLHICLLLRQSRE